MSACRLVVPALLLVFAGLAVGQSTRPADQVQMIELPLKLPAVGNIEAVREWRFGRVESAEQSTASIDDVTLAVRLPDGTVLRLAAPRAPLADLARFCGWTPAGQARPGRSHFAERMVAFDADDSGRLIAMMSLEPMDRNNRRLQRAIGR